MDVSSWVSMPMSSFTGGYCSGVRVAATGQGGERDTRGSDPPVRVAQRPVACAPRSVMTVELARATSRCFSSTTSHSTRSEEHTSELQSLAYLVCRLLLEKKKKKAHHIVN